MWIRDRTIICHTEIKREEKHTESYRKRERERERNEDRERKRNGWRREREKRDMSTRGRENTERQKVRKREGYIGDGIYSPTDLTSL